MKSGSVRRSQVPRSVPTPTPDTHTGITIRPVVGLRVSDRPVAGSARTVGRSVGVHPEAQNSQTQSSEWAPVQHSGGANVESQTLTTITMREAENAR